LGATWPGRDEAACALDVATPGLYDERMQRNVSESESAPLVEALKASEERYQFLAETIPVHIWTALPTGLLDYVSEQTARHLGMTAQQLLSDGWQSVVHPDDLGHAVEQWMHSLRTGDVYEVEFRLKLASGNYAFHLARAVPQRDAEGMIVRWFGTNTYIDEQREQLRQRQVLFDEVAQQLRESAVAFVDLQQKYEKAVAQLAQTKPLSKPSTQSVAVDWQAVALARLSKLLGDEEGGRVFAATLAAAPLERIASASDLQRFANVLKPQGGLLGATGAQLYLHAVIHGR
jgi:PAS domain S-box-containing protein